MNQYPAVFWGRLGVIAASLVVLCFLMAPIILVMTYAFSASNVQTFPIQGWSLHWLHQALADPQVRESAGISVQVACLATVIATLLGCLAAFAIHSFNFFGRDSAVFFLTLPIALPGIITGMAMSSFFAFMGIHLSFWTLVIAHATFCTPIVYNTVIGRLARLPKSFTEASADLGGDGFYTFARVTLPLVGSAITAAALLAFALSFDEVIVTTFTAGTQTTLPLWVLGSIRLGQSLPEVNVVVSAVIIFTLIPVLLVQRLSGDAGRV
ncbi:ABC transporter permease [Asticcacaulis taihuensis]|uniref:ABC transporter permease n=1 Tax=Asticcacaulis taihuensis TaxID=260084 RepID=UPI0026E999E1|nr:ABC transporter permease [Asticcacaulis taihuensis]